MKKLLIILLLILLSINIFAQTMDLNGYDWIGYSVQDKAMYLIGFDTAYGYSVEFLKVLKDDLLPSEKAENALIKYSNPIPITAGQLMEKIDAIYSQQKYLKIEIFKVIFYTWFKVGNIDKPDEPTIPYKGGQ